MKQQTKWFIWAIIRYSLIGIFLLALSNFLIWIISLTLHIPETTIPKIMEHAMQIGIIVILYRKLTKRFEFYLLFGFAVGKSHEKQMRIYQRFADIILAAKKYLPDLVDYMEIPKMLKQIPGIKFNNEQKPPKELRDFMSALLLLNDFQLINLQQFFQENESS